MKNLVISIPAEGRQRHAGGDRGDHEHLGRRLSWECWKEWKSTLNLKKRS